MGSRVRDKKVSDPVILMDDLIALVESNRTENVGPVSEPRPSNLRITYFIVKCPSVLSWGCHSQNVTSAKAVRAFPWLRMSDTKGCDTKYRRNLTDDRPDLGAVAGV